MKTVLASLALGASILSSAASALAPAAGPTEQANLTRQQALERADRLFQQLDLNHDGIVTRDEAMQAGQQLRAERAATGRDVAPGLGGHTARYLEHKFAGTQSVNQQQFEAAMLAHFDKMDTNHDGVLTPQERQLAGSHKP